MYLRRLGAAGGGKTCGMLIDAVRRKNVQGFGAVFFRKNYNQIFSQGGLWDESMELFSGIKNAHPQYGAGRWLFRDSTGKIISKISFAHIERDAEVHKWQGSQICGIYFDELTHFTENIFFYMLSRNRSVCGVKPYVRATCNPDVDSWVAKFISWWIDAETGYPIKERSGVIRWMIRRDDTIYWADTKNELVEKFNLITPEEMSEPKSVTFIASTIYDNKILLKSNPSYLANLKALPLIERERLLEGNWKIKAAAGMYFKRTQVNVIETPPQDIRLYCRAWDLAATEDKESGDPDYTAGVLMGIRRDGTVAILDVINLRIKAGEVEKLIYNTALSDRKSYGTRYRVRIPQDPGAAGKIVASAYIKKLAGFAVKALPVTGSKQLRATPFAAQWQNGNVAVLAAEWNDAYFSQLESFPESKHDDMVDASSDAFNELSDQSFDLKNLI